MVHAPNPDFLAEITGALGWWREAGVDCDFLDEPRQWLAPPDEEGDDERRPERPRQAPAEDSAAPPPPARFDPAALPRDLAAFGQWWLGEPLLDEGGTTGRVLPQGAAGARLMVVVDMPEPEDRQSLLSGPQGRLLDAMLEAFGTSRREIYLASALPRAVPAPDWPAMMGRGLGQVLMHHVALAAPERLFVLGTNVLPLLGHELPQRSAVLRTFNHEGRTIPLLASRGLPALLAQPRWKAVLWRAWLDWTAR